MNTQYWNDNVSNMKAYVPGQQPAITEHTIKLNTNENPYPPSSRVLDAIHAAADASLRLYPSANWKTLRQDIADAYRVPVEQIFCGNGSDEILSLIMRSFANPGDRILLSEPTYSLYEILASGCGLETVQFETREDFTIPFAALPDEGYAIAFFANPNAPTGILASLEELESFISRFQGVVVVDEAYIDFCDHPEASTACNLLNDHPNLIVTRTFSKSFSLCGLRVGYAFAQTNLTSALMRLKDSYNLDSLAQTGAAAAIKDIAVMQDNAATIRKTREESARTLQKLGFSILPSQANFLFVRPPGGDGKSLYAYLQKQEIYVRWFDTSRLRDYLRISIGTDIEMKQLLDAIKNFMNNDFMNNS